MRAKLVGLLSALMLLLISFPAYAAVEYGTVFTSIKTEAETALDAVIPLAAGIFGVLAAVAIGFRLFRKVTGRT